MADYHTFTTVRVTRPNPIALLAALRALDATAGVTEISGAWRIKKDTLWSAPQIAAAQTALDTCAADTLELEAQQAIDAMGIFDKAIVLVTLDQFNLVRGKLRGLGVTGIPDLTIAQMIQAIRDKAGTL